MNAALPGQPSPAPTLEALRAAGAQRLDPMGLRFLEELARRSEGAQGEVRRLLLARLEQGLAEAMARVAGRTAATTMGPRAAVAPAPRHAPLAALNQYIRDRGGVSRVGQEPSDEGEMRSAQRFRRTWSRIAAEEQVTQALRQGPTHAGPLNPHQLVLRSMELMRELSPHYLQRFLSHAQTLLWLEQAQARSAAPEKAAKKARREK